MTEPDRGGERDYPEPDREVESMSPADLKRRLDTGEPVRLLDTRNRSAVEAWRIDAPTRVDIPYVKFQAAEVTDSVTELVTDTPVVDDRESPLVVVCAEGRASAYVAGLLGEAGIEAVNLEGGMYGWARLYEARVVAERPLVVGYARPSSGCLAYLVVGDDAAAEYARQLHRTLTERFARFDDHVLANLGDRPANHERIVAINLGRAAPGAGEAFELELGPNNCAVGAAGADAD